jgi:aerobic-type carbon monoxide dehydrogenase small subunit (CoxS/CutS family)
MRLLVNGVWHEADVEPDTPLLWVLRDSLGLNGTKFGCGVGFCGACTVHVDGQARTSCDLSVAEVGNRPVTTIEGLSADGSHPLQQAWIEHRVPQCGYCQPGFIMAAAALIEGKRPVGDREIDRLTNICRCGTYNRIRSAIKAAANG